MTETGSKNLPGAVKDRLRRRLLRLRFLLFQRHRQNRLVMERVAGHPIIVLPTVFNPALFFSSGLFAATLRSIDLKPETKVLEVGTGSGLLSIVAAERSGNVTATDINPDSVRCARINVLMNGCEGRVETLQGDLFDSVAGRRFDMILCNPPHFRGRPRDFLDAAWRSEDFAERFAGRVGEHLGPDGSVLIILSSVGDERGFLKAMDEGGFARNVAGRRDLFGEILTVHRFRRARPLIDANEG